MSKQARIRRDTRPPTVLILTSRLDFATDYITAALADKDIPFLRLNSEDLPDLQLCWVPTGPSLVVRGANLPETEVGLALQSALVRRPTFLRSPSGPPVAALAAHHWLTFMRGLLSFPSLRWMNHPASDFVAENKMVQLRAAWDVGFRIPATVVTNSSSAALQHITEATDLAIKGLDTVLWRDGDSQFFGYTRSVSKSELADSDLSSVPTIVQEHIRPKVDVRVTVVHDQIWAAEISGGGTPIEGDWRLLKDHVTYAEHVLPRTVRSRCIALVRELQLEFAAIDLAKRSEGYVFFEVNPVGEWGWLADHLGWNIASSIAEWLANDP